MDNPFTRTNRAAVILAHLPVSEGMTVLDLGCGPGRLTIPTAAVVGAEGEVVAVDVQQGMLDRAKARADAMGLRNVTFVHAAAGDGALGERRFDRALMVTVLGEIPDAVAALREVGEALKADGILSVTEVIFDPHFQRQSKVRQWAKQAGLKQVALFGNRIAYTMHLAPG